MAKHIIKPTLDSSKEELIAKFTNHIMHAGKKSTADRIISDMMTEIKKRTKQDPETIFVQAINNISPRIETRSRRVGGSNYQIPHEVGPMRRVYLGMVWIRNAARDKSGKSMYQRLADEIIDASNEQGVAFKKKEDTHKMADANKAFAHFARYSSR